MKSDHFFPMLIWTFNNLIDYLVSFTNFQLDCGENLHAEDIFSFLWQSCVLYVFITSAEKGLTFHC